MLLVGLRLTLRLQAPSERERLAILKCLVAEFNVASDVSLQHIATQTAALIAADLRDLVFRAQAACMTRVG
jgi:peroxin-6